MNSEGQEGGTASITDMETRPCGGSVDGILGVSDIRLDIQVKTTLQYQDQNVQALFGFK